MEVNRKYFLEKNFLIYLTGKGASALISIASIPLFIRIYGAANYGSFVLIYSFFLMALSLSNGWINQAMIRFFHADENQYYFLKDLKKLTLISALIIGSILVCLLYFKYSGIITLIIIFLCFILGSIYTFKLVENQTVMQPKNVVFAEVLRLSFFLGIPYLLYYLDWGTFMYQLFFGILLGYTAAFLFLKSKEKTSFVSENRKKTSIKEIATYGIPLSIWMVFSPTTNGVDRYLIEYYLGAIALAQYSAVYDIVFKVFSQLSIPLNSIVQPLLMYAHNKKENKIFSKTIGKAALYLLIIFIVIFSLFSFFKELIIVQYLGFDDREVINQLKLVFEPLIISSFIWQIGILLQKRLEVQNKTLTMAILMLLSVSLSVLASIWLIPIYGFIASAYLMLLTSILYSSLVLFMIYRK
ncbi:lipopolysaccharide biosynthesis protein [Croceitalea vernalis]|uniref:Oligosaccharide flippase family protein n=1 Tax=Croceitalea vernalis TaxID=3075599 RepID=A0ABU3BEC8_9FLAO|nr:oligosaccharide flippase family protein [Croceitalea sp. P007]MDT0620506.1 oligosaccharide flippase family protein [Croceitalea sp. P007]